MNIPDRLRESFCGVVDALAGLDNEQKRRVLGAAFQLVQLASSATTKRRSKRRPRQCSVCGQRGHDARRHELGASSQALALFSPRAGTRKAPPKKQKRQHEASASNGIGAS